MKLNGKKYHFLTIIADLGTKPEKNGHKVRWIRCKCDCGSTVSCRAQNVLSEARKSCGCINESKFTLKERKQRHACCTNNYRKRHSDRYLQYSKRYRTKPSVRYSILKYSAKCRHIEMKITQEQHMCLLNNTCHYCNKSIAQESGAGLDRIDNSLGYTVRNVLPCCCACNRIRNNYLTVDEMEFIMKQLITYRKRKALAFIR